MVEAAVALSRDFGLSRRQAYRYLEEAQAVASPPVVAEASVTITLKIPSNISSARIRPVRTGGPFWAGYSEERRLSAIFSVSL
jgi:hypothetical protein